eukprot:364975-Chlamydomonas_euryale.AAC.10
MGYTFTLKLSSKGFVRTAGSPGSQWPVRWSGGRRYWGAICSSSLLQLLWWWWCLGYTSNQRAQLLEPKLLASQSFFCIVAASAARWQHQACSGEKALEDTQTVQEVACTLVAGSQSKSECTLQGCT